MDNQSAQPAASPVVTLNKAEVRARVQAAHIARELQAQNTYLAEGCYYRSPAGPCAIGACITDTELAFIQEHTSTSPSIGEIIRNRLAVTDDRGWLVGLQAAHDAWASAEPGEQPLFEADFLRVLNS